jgi:hypothetical protein
MANYYAGVPKGLNENLKFRAKIRAEAERSTATQRELARMCAEDTLFFINAFSFLIEPRDAVPIKPFITWPHQDRFFRRLDANLTMGLSGVRRLLKAEKSRAEGFSWSMEWFGLAKMRFRPYTIFGQVSKDKDTADLPGDPGSLMGKLDWALTGQLWKDGPFVLPRWLFPENSWDRRRGNDSILTFDNGSYTRAYAATDDVGTGGRWTFGFLDEFAKFHGNATKARASTQFLSNFLVVGSTYKGRQGEFYDMMQDQDLGETFVFDWKENPTRSEGMYRVTDGKVEVIDPEKNPLSDALKAKYYGEVPIEEIHKALRRRGFKIEGTERSPWFDRECMDGTPRTIAEELERSPSGTEENYMDRDMLRELLEGEERTAQEPKYRGMLAYDPETLEPRFIERADGDLLVWIDLVQEIGPDGKVTGNLVPPSDRDYTVGADISFGVGASNSATSVIDKSTGDQVAEYASRHVPPEQFARFNIALCKWFKGMGSGAYHGWEANGTNGKNYTSTITQCEYSNVYRREVKEEFGPKTTNKLGWVSTTGDKNEILGGVDGGGLLLAMSKREVKVRSADCLKECHQYVIKNGKVLHIRSANTTNEAEMGEAHGDRVIALAIAVHLLKKRPQAKEEVKPDVEPPYGSRAWRDRLRERERAEQAEEAFSW